jgi:CRISPR-associated protein (TIGR02710 family)
VTTALIVTVGGSHQPVLTSIRQHRPDRVYFLCSADQGRTPGSHVLVNGPGLVIKSDFKLPAPDQPSIVAQLGLSANKFHVHQIEQFDDLNTCYLAAADLLARARQELPGTRLLADYTAGTKTMSAGLVAAALDDGNCELALVVGQRSDLVKVVNRTEFARRVNVADTQAHRRLQAAGTLTARYDYAAAEQVLRDAAAEPGSSAGLQRLQRGIALCQAFDQWDRFEHTVARDCLEAHHRDFVSHWRVLKALCGADRGHGFEWVEDLLHNAERRFAQGRYDDAVGRIYRAVELTAQVWLKERHGVDSGDVDLSRVPEVLRAALERLRPEGKHGQPESVKIGLRAAWELIAVYPDDPLGALYGPMREPLVSFQKLRNASLFAHGLRAITRADYEGVAPALRNWLLQAIEAAMPPLGRKWQVRMKQLPTDFLMAPQ